VPKQKPGAIVDDRTLVAEPQRRRRRREPRGKRASAAANVYQPAELEVTSGKKYARVIVKRSDFGPPSTWLPTGRGRFRPRR